jgi:hypothetical protein
MKRYYAIACATATMCAAFLALHALPAAAESHQVLQPQVSELLTMAVAPYKW